MGNIIVVGSINVDLTSYLDRWPNEGDTIKTQMTKIGTGGKGANQCCTVAKLGGHVHMIGAIGADGFGQDAKATLLDCGVISQIVHKEDATTGMAFIDVGPDGNNIIRIAEGANGALTAQDVAKAWESVGKADVLLLQNEVPLEVCLAAAQLALRDKVTTIMDPAPAPTPMWGDDILAQFDIITPNGGEAEAILGYKIETLDAAFPAAQSLAKKTRKGAVVTMGHLGVAWSIDGHEGTMDCPKVDAIDTVAAGDCFNGAFAYCLGEGKPYAEAIEFASHAASLATTKRGAISSLPVLEDVTAFLKA